MFLFVLNMGFISNIYIQIQLKNNQYNSAHFKGKQIFHKLKLNAFHNCLKILLQLHKYIIFEEYES